MIPTDNSSSGYGTVKLLCCDVFNIRCVTFTCAAFTTIKMNVKAILTI